MTDETENRIELNDNSNSETADMADKQEQTQQEQPEGQEQTQSTKQQGEGRGSWYEKPEGMGNAAGEWVQGKLNPVGQYAGKGFETVGKPVGGIVDPIVGGLMRGGEAFGDQVGVGYGNKEGGPAKQQEAEGERMKQPIAGEEQTADNPLGLNSKS